MNLTESAKVCAGHSGMCIGCPLEFDRDNCWTLIHDKDNADVRLIAAQAAVVEAAREWADAAFTPSKTMHDARDAHERVVAAIEALDALGGDNQ